jgi:hypothetical protein
MPDSQPTTTEVFATAPTEGVKGVVAQGQMGSISAKSETPKAICFKHMQGFIRRKMASFRIFPFQPSIGILGLGQK